MQTAYIYDDVPRCQSRITGKERDSETAFDYFGARYYGSNMGRFMTPDWSSEAVPVPYASFADPQSLNLYSYVRNNPLSRFDLDGHKPLDCSGGNAAGIGCQWIAAWDAQHGIDSLIRYQVEAFNSGPQDDDAPRDHTVTISDWPRSAGGFHHAGICVDCPDDDTRGFAPLDSSTPWWKRLFWAPIGNMEDDIDHHTKNGEVAKHKYTYIMVTAKQADAIAAAIKARRDNPGRYNLLFRNCAQAVESFLNAGKVYGTPLGVVNFPFVLSWFVQGTARSQ
jgi:RHS repeat-associated protein